MNTEQWNYNELKAHYIAVRQRLGGLGKSAGLVPITATPVVVLPPSPEPEDIVWDVKHLPRNNFTRFLIEVAKKYNIDPNILVSHNRKKDIVAIRREFVYGAHKNLKYSQSQIARWLNRDHTSINNDIQKWEMHNNVSA